MHKEATIRRQGDDYRLFCRNYMGPYAAKLIAKRLQLEEVAAPDEGPSANGLTVGQFYTWELMSRHPELHAVIPADRLDECAAVVRDFHMEVTEGKDLLPKLPEVETKPDHHESYVTAIEERHKSVLQKGPKAVLSALLVRAVPAVLVLGLLFIAFRHFGDHHQTASISTMFIRAEKPPVEQSFWAGLINPDHSHSLRTQVRGVRFLDGNRMIFVDGNFVAIEGVEDLRPMFELARKQAVAPTIDATIEDGKIMIEKITCGDESFTSGGELVRIARFGASGDEPRRSTDGNPNLFHQLRTAAYDNEDLLKNLVGKRVALIGKVKDEDGRRVLRMENGSGVVLNVARRYPELNEFIDVFTGDTADLQVDMVLKSVYSLKNKKEPSQARGETKLIGEADVYSASAHNFHVIARR